MLILGQLFLTVSAFWTWKWIDEAVKSRRRDTGQIIFWVWTYIKVKGALSDGEHARWGYANYRIYSINRPGRLLNFHHFQQVKYVYFVTKQ